MTLWLAAAGLGVVALALVLVAGRDSGSDDADLPTLPIGAGVGAEGDAADDRAATAAPGVEAELSILPAGTYVPGEGLPELGGEAPVYRLDAAPDRAAVQRLAESLGIDGEPTESGGSWHVEDGKLALDVYGPEGGWSIYPTAWTDPAAGDDTATSDGREPAVLPAPLDCPTIDPVPADGGGSSGNAGSTGSAGPDGSLTAEIDILKCEEPVPPEPVRPANLPSSDEARTIALDLLESTGADIEGAEVTIDDGVTEWFVSVEPRVGGLRAPGLAMYVGVGDEGRVVSASGYLATPEKLGDYPLLDTTEALKRLNDQRTYVGPAVDLPAAAAREPALDEPGVAVDTQTVAPAPTSSAPASDPGDDLPVLTPPVEPVPETALPPDTTQVEPVPETAPPPDVTIEPPPETPLPPETTVPPAPPEVAVTDAEVVLVWESSWDGSGTYLVPGYQFTADDDSNPVIGAVEDDLLEPPPADPGQAEPLPTEPGQVELPPTDSDQVEPLPADPGQVEPGEPAVPPGRDPDQPVSSPGG